MRFGRVLIKIPPILCGEQVVTSINLPVAVVVSYERLPNSARAHTRRCG